MHLIVLEANGHLCWRGKCDGCGGPIPHDQIADGMVPGTEVTAKVRMSGAPSKQTYTVRITLCRNCAGVEGI